jgi:competence protein ComGC
MILHRPEEKNHAPPTRTKRQIHPAGFLLVLVLLVVLVVVIMLLLRIFSCL